MSATTVSSIVIKILLDLAIILLSTKLFGMLAKKLGLPSVVGMVFAGLIIGPSIIGLFTNGFGLISPLKEDVITLTNGEKTSIEFMILEAFSQIGVVFILFTGGLKTNIKKIKKNAFCSTTLAAIGVLIPLVLGFLLTVVYLGGFSKVFQDKDLFINCLFVGTIMTATSVAITIETLMELGKISSETGAILTSAAIIDDIIGIIVLSVVLSLKNGTNIGFTFLKIAIFFVLAISLGFLIRKLFKWLDGKGLKLREKTLLAVIICLVYSFCAKEVFGIAAITGAYMAGLMLSGLKDSSAVAKNVMDTGHLIFIPVFFAFIGINADFSNFKLSSLLFGALFVIIAIAGKLVAGFITGKCFRKSNRQSLQLGAGMVARGEIALAVYGSGYILIAKNGIDPIIGVVLLIIVSSIVCPLLLKWFFKNKKTVKQEKEEQSQAS